MVYYPFNIFSRKLIKIWNSKLQFFVMKTPSVSLPFNLSLLIALTKQRVDIDFVLHHLM